MTTLITQMGRDEFFDVLQLRHQPILGREGCLRLRDSTVALAGLGGIGALTLELLVRAGVGRFRLLDYDIYEPSNLNRQIFATIHTLGKPKVEVAARRIREINPFAVVEQTFFERAGSRNMRELVAGADIGVVCTDSPSSYVFWNQAAGRERLRLACGFSAKMECGVWVVAHDRPKQGLHKVKSRLGRKMRSLLSLAPWPWDLDEEAALALDVPASPDEGFTPAVGFVTNSSACMLAGIVVSYLTGAETRPLSLRLSHRKPRMLSPRLHSLKQLFRRNREGS
ncbi:MAG: ThiF family adenylyltransferase [Thermodesulfobacteriota bacterium]